MRYYLIPLVIANRKAREQVWQGCEKRESLYTLGGTVNWFSHQGEQYEGYSKKMKNSNNKKQDYYTTQQSYF